jgi:hypothetical protein
MERMEVACEEEGCQLGALNGRPGWLSPFRIAEACRGARACPGS